MQAGWYIVLNGNVVKEGLRTQQDAKKYVEEHREISGDIQYLFNDSRPGLCDWRN